MFFRRRKTQQLEKYIVKEPFVLREWGDSHGLTECSRQLPIGTQLTIQSHKNGKVKRIWIDGVEYGQHKLITTKAEIAARCIKR